MSKKLETALSSTMHKVRLLHHKQHSKHVRGRQATAESAEITFYGSGVV